MRVVAGLEEAQVKIRDPRAPTMADTGVLANVTVLEGGHAQGTLGQAGRLKELVRQMTPTKILGEGGVGCVFGGGKALLGEGDHQDCIKVCPYHMHETEIWYTVRYVIDIERNINYNHEWMLQVVSLFGCAFVSGFCLALSCQFCKEEWLLQVVAQSPLHVLAVPIEQLLLSDPGGVVPALRQYIALQLTYWFSRCGMIGKHVCSRL